MTDTAELQFIDELPPMKRGRQTSTVKQDAMTANPGRWLVWGKSISSEVRKELVKGGYEVTVRTVDGASTVYARFPGDTADPSGW